MNSKLIIQLLKKITKSIAPYIIVKKYLELRDKDKINQINQKQEQITNQKQEQITNQNLIAQMREKNRMDDIIYQINSFNDIFLKEADNGNKYFDFNGLKFADIRNDFRSIQILPHMFFDTLFIYMYFNDNYNKSIVKLMDLFMPEGPYCYIDTSKSIDITVKKDDIVIDAGAWIGDFSIYAAKKGATVYAFEPTNLTFNFLKESILLNSDCNIIPEKMGLSNNNRNTYIRTGIGDSGANRIVDENIDVDKQVINTITLDSYINEHDIHRVDFIKADIEVHERYMLEGAKNTLKDFSQRLSLCTYHLADDKIILPEIILDANPNYKFVQLRHKLLCYVD